MFKAYLALPRSVYLLCAGTLINRAGTFVVPFLAIYLTDRLNFEKQFAMWALAAFGGGSIVAAVMGGALADRIGRRAVMLISLTGGAALLVVLGTLQAPSAILVAVAGFALLAEMYRPAVQAMVADLVPPEQRPHAYGLIYLSINLGFSVAGTIGGTLAQYSFRWLFWGDALTNLSFAVIIGLAISETLPRRDRGADPGAAGQTDREAPAGSALRHILGNGTFVIFCLASFAVAMVYMQGMSTFPLYLTDLGISARTYGRIIAVNGLMIVCFQVPVSAGISRLPRGPVVMASALVTALGFGVIGLSVVPWHFVIAVVIWTLGEMMQAPLMSTIVTDLAPVAFRARYLGAFSMCYSSANVIGAPLGGAVLVHIGPGWLWGGCGLLGVLAAALYLTISRRLRV